MQEKGSTFQIDQFPKKTGNRKRRKKEENFKISYTFVQPWEKKSLIRGRISSLKVTGKFTEQTHAR